MSGSDAEGGSNHEVPLSGGGRTPVHRAGDEVRRASGPWSPTVQTLLLHLEQVGFAAAPRVVGTGIDDRGREMLTYVEGEILHPGPWSEEALARLGAILRDLHRATASFPVPENAVWQSWFGRELGRPDVIGHCDVGPWNVVSMGGAPVAIIDWEVAGPVDHRVELAQMCWLNAQLHDDDIAKRQGLADAEVRARHARAILDGYELSRSDRVGFVDRMIRLAVRDAAEQAIEAGVTPETRDPEPLWAITWRTRSAAWMTRHRAMLQRALT